MRRDIVVRNGMFWMNITSAHNSTLRCCCFNALGMGTILVVTGIHHGLPQVSELGIAIDPGNCEAAAVVNLEHLVKRRV